jgi:hypothetical protein
MSKILVVEPYKILQRAMAITFFPEHEVQITGAVPEIGEFEQRSYDVVIIDAGALRETDTAGDLNHRVQDWPIPVICFGSRAGPRQADSIAQADCKE